MSDVKKSALWALVSIPISIFGVFISWAIIHVGGILYLPFIPAVLVIDLDVLKESPEWLVWGTALVAQYLGYFLLTFFLIKVFRILKNTRAENIAKEQSENDPPGSWTDRKD